MKGLATHVLPVVFTIALLQACGGGSGGSNTPAGSDENTEPEDTQTENTESEDTQSDSTQSSELEGVWRKLCGPADTSDSNTHYDIVTVTFSGNELSSDIENYEDSACTAPLSIAPNPTASGTFVVGDTLTLSDGTQATTLDSHIDTYDGAPFVIDEYGIYRIEGDILYMEDDTGVRDATSPELRPDILDYNRPFYRQ
jgi:hypothetical protein